MDSQVFRALPYLWCSLPNGLFSYFGVAQVFALAFKALQSYCFVARRLLHTSLFLLGSMVRLVVCFVLIIPFDTSCSVGGSPYVVFSIGDALVTLARQYWLTVLLVAASSMVFSIYGVVLTRSAVLQCSAWCQYFRIALGQGIN